MAITALPSAPSRQDPANFATKADAWVSAMDLFTTEANALQADVNTKQTTASAAATTATPQASEAATSATNAATSATAATTSATNASNSAASAATSATNAANSYDAFDDRYLGSKASDPTLDNDGAALLEGALYWNSTSKTMKTYNGSSWVSPSVVGGAVSTLEVPDNGFTLKDNTDSSKKANFELSGITTATTRSYTLPNSDGALATTANIAQTFSGATTFSQTVTASITGNAGTVTNGVYTAGDQTIGGTKTFSASPVIPAGSAGTHAANVNQVNAAYAPAGTVIFHASSTAPTGYLKANGAAVSRTTYASLFTAIGTTYGVGDGASTFNLPDLRGEFLRGWDDSRGLDSGRGFASVQGSQNLSHAHTAGTSTHNHQHLMFNNTTVGPSAGINVGSGSYVAGITSGGSDFAYVAQQSSGNAGPNVGLTSVDSHAHTVSVNSDGGTEARPRNIALLACIKY